MHGCLSTGPRTAAGLAYSKRVRWKHDRYSAEAGEEMRRFRELLRKYKQLEELISGQPR
jgi:hypothetical protein